MLGHIFDELIWKLFQNILGKPNHIALTCIYEVLELNELYYVSFSLNSLRIPKSELISI
jgi:hypothetical protein